MSTKADFVAKLGGGAVTLQDTVVVVADTVANTITDTAHARLTGDGPVEISSTGSLPGGTGAIAATGLLTGSLNFLNNETVLIGAKTYTMKNTLTGAANEIQITADVAASKALTFSDVGINGETVTIDGHVYTFKTALTPLADEVLVAGTAAAQATYLFEAINKGANGGTHYASATVAHATVTATNGSAGVVTVTAKTAGTAGNSIAISETCTNAAFAGGATALSGGAMNLQTTLANLKNAINAGAGAGTAYGTGTTANATVSCSASDATTLTIGAVTAGVAGNALATTETAASASFGATTLTGGQDNTFYVIVVDANTIKLATSVDNALAGTAVDITTSGSGTIKLSTSVSLMANSIEAAMLSMQKPGNCTLPPAQATLLFWQKVLAAFNG